MGRRKHRKRQGQHRRRADSPPKQRPNEPAIDRAFLLWLIAVFLVALGARLIHVGAIASAPVAQLLLGDAESYYSWAVRLVSGDWAGSEVFYQAPLYPYFLGALFSVFEPDVGIVRLAQAVLGALACVFLALAGRSWFSSTVGVVAGFLLALYGPAVFFVGLVQKTTLALVLFALLLWLLGASSKDSRRPLALWAATGACLALTALARENALILVFPIAFWIVLAPATTGTTRVRSVAAFTIGLAAILAPVTLRNYAVGGDVAVTTSQLGTNLYIGNNPDANGTYQPLRAGRDDPRFEAFDARAIAEERSGRSLAASEVSSFYVGEVIDYIRAEPWDWAQLMGRKLMLAGNAAELADTEDLLSHAEYSAVLHATQSVWHYGLLLPLAVVGGVLTWSDAKRRSLLLAMVAAYGAGLVAFFIFARYRFFLVPVLILFAAAALLGLVQLVRKPRLRPGLLAIASGAIVATIANRPLVEPDVMSSVTHYNYGLGFEREGQEEMARRSYLRAISFAPSLAEAHYRVGVLDAQDARVESAIAHFESAVALAPDYHAVRTSLGFLLLKQGDTEGAEEQFREALRLVPTDSQALNNLANLAFQRRDLEEARSLYQRSAELDPANAQTHNNLGIIAAIRNELPKAIQHFRDALTIDPGYEDARLNLARAQTGT